MPRWVLTVTRTLQERWLRRGWSPIRVTFAVAAGVITLISVIGYMAHKGSPGAVWWLLLGLVILLVWAMSESMRWRIKHSRLEAAHAACPEVGEAASSAETVDRTSEGLRRMHRWGAKALATFERSELSLSADERAGLPDPQGRPYDVWHQLGASDLTDWLQRSEQWIQPLLGEDAVAQMCARRQHSPIKVVPSTIRADYHDLWLESSHRLDWVADQYEARGGDPLDLHLGP